MLKLFSSLTRRKTAGDEGGSQLARVLSLLDLTALGVGSTLGLGVYILAGSVARTMAGPAVCLSFLVAAFASALAGLCYAEFASRVPQAGSAYVYSYVSVGEFVAYIIGWNLILEYVIGTASVARGLSGYLNELTSHQIENKMKEWMPMSIAFLANYPDFMALCYVLLVTVLLSIGVKESTQLNNAFTLLNLFTITTAVVAGSLNADLSNWNIPKEAIPAKFADAAGDGGFMPFGVAGVMAGAAKCFYGFVGFDAVATTGEEAKDPKRNIPLAIVISLVVIFLAYFSISVVLTLMWPYYDQNVDAPFPYVFDQIGWTGVKMVITFGAIVALCTALLGAMFPLPRIVYAMANDGLIYTALAKVNPKSQTPVVATVLSGLLSGLMATIFDLDQLIDMMSIGTLLAYTIVAVCVLILRYSTSDCFHFSQTDVIKQDDSVFFSMFKLLFNLNMNKCPNSSTSILTNWAIGLFSIFSFLFGVFVMFGLKNISVDQPLFLTTFIMISVILIILLIVIARQPEDTVTELSFKVPWVPILPCISIMANIYLMLQLNIETWIRFIVWLIIGFLIYFYYGIHNSKEVKNNVKQGTATNTSDCKR